MSGIIMLQNIAAIVVFGALIVFYMMISYMIMQGH